MSSPVPPPPSTPLGNQPTGGPVDPAVAGTAALTHINLCFIGLIIWLMKKDQHPFINEQGKEGLNWFITIVLISVVMTVITFLVPVLGFLSGLVGLVGLIFMIIAYLKTKTGVGYRYPFALRLIK